jgi:serine/threonine protein kinase
VQDASERVLYKKTVPTRSIIVEPAPIAPELVIAHPSSDRETHYQIGGILGEGGSGTTYRAQILGTDRSVALKQLSLVQMDEWKALELFEREAQILAQLNHPAIPKYIDYFTIDTPTDRNFYIVQELAPGKTLSDLSAAGWRCTEAEVRDIASQILAILSYLHKLAPPVIHRDLKPSNILRTETGQISLVDFGAVRQAYHDTFMRGSTVVGTFGYMAPEQFRAQALPATDLYGLGATLLALLTNRSPAEIPQEGLRLNFRDRLEVSPHFTDWLEKMLEPDLARRYSSATAAIAALNKKHVIQRGSRSSHRKTEISISISILVAVMVSIFGIFDRYKYFLLSQIGITYKEPFTAMVRSRDTKIIKEYLDRGFDVNARNENGYTLLNMAVYDYKQDSNEIINLLIDRGADISDDTHSPKEIRDKTKSFAEIISYCRNTNDSMATIVGNACVDLMSDKRQHLRHRQGFMSNNLVLHALDNNQPGLLKKLIDRGLRINKPHPESNSFLLHLSSIYPDGQLIKTLLSEGMNVNETDPQQCTPLHHAIYKYHKNKHKYYGSNMFFSNTNTSIELDVNGRAIDMAIVYLIRNGADVDKKCSISLSYMSHGEKLSPVELAIKIGEPSLIYLVQVTLAGK